MRAFQADVLKRGRKAVDELLAVFAFRPDDAELENLPGLQGRWEDDLFNPEVLMEAGKKLGLGAMVGAGLGVVADVALAGLSFGAATTLGATLGGLASQGWRPLWRKLENRMQGVQELTLEDTVLVVLADQLLLLLQALEHRGHAAMDKVHYLDQTEPEQDRSLAERLFPVLRALTPARGHPEWEGGSPGWRNAWQGQGDRAECLADTAQALQDVLPPLQA